MDRPHSSKADSVRTFAHIGDPVPAPDHAPFWKHWFERLIEHAPVITRRNSPDPSDPSATHEFNSTGEVNIGCRLVLPSNDAPVAASLVSVHGDHTPDPLEVNARRWQRVADRGVAVLLMRLRGYPGSQISTGPLTGSDQRDRAWITRGFDSARNEDWIVPQSIMDVCNACRVMRNAMLHRDTDTDIPVSGDIEHPGVYLHGSSLGAGLAVISAAQLIGKLRGESIIDRLAIATPSVGDWPSRFDRPSGTALHLKRIIDANPDRYDELMARLKLCDAVVHGRKVRVPTFAMLAREDDIVSPECAAAVFNAIDADPGRKWRFLIQRGHGDGDTTNTRRIALYAQALCDFFDPQQTPIEAMSRWEPLMHDGLNPPADVAAMEVE